MHGRRGDDVVEAYEILLVAKRASEDERERDRAELSDVGALVELGDTSGERQSNAKLFPVPFA